MRIAYVEDNPTNLALVERIAKMTKHNVVAYSEGEVALESLKAEPFDLILMDVELAGELNGLEVVRRLRAHGLKTPIVAVTAYAMMGDRDRCLALGCDDYLPKPLPINDFISLLARYDAIVKSGAPAGPVPVTIPSIAPAPTAAQPATPAPIPAQPAPVSTPAAVQPAPAVVQPAAPAPAPAPAPAAAQPATPAPTAAPVSTPAAVQPAAPVTATPPASPVAETPAAPAAAPAPETPGTSPSSALPVTQPNVVSSAASSSTMSQPQPVVPSENAPVNPTQPPSAIDVSADKGGSEARLSI